MNIYFATTVKGIGAGKEFNEYIVELLKRYGNVWTEHLVAPDIFEQEEQFIKKGGNVFLRDIDWLNRSDCLVAEISGSSFGIGYEICYSLHSVHIPVCALFCVPPEKISRMALDNTMPSFEIHQYATKQDLELLIANFMNKGINRRT